MSPAGPLPMTSTLDSVRPWAGAPSSGPPGVGETMAASVGSPIIEIAPPNGAASGVASSPAPKLILTPPNGLALPLGDAAASSPGLVSSVMGAIVVSVC